MAALHSSTLPASSKYLLVRSTAHRKLNRTQWGKQNTWCWICGATHGLQCHEICRGPARAAAIKEPACWVRTCMDCHEPLGDYAEWPIVRQLALKLARDPNHYDLDVVNAIRGRASTAIEQWEVDEALESIDPVPVYLLDPFC